MTIVTYTHRYKRTPRKKPKALRSTCPPSSCRAGNPKPPAKPASVAAERKSAIVTVTSPRRSRFGDVPDMTPEEHRRRGDAAAALFRELVRRATPQE